MKKLLIAASLAGVAGAAAIIYIKNKLTPGTDGGSKTIDAASKPGNLLSEDGSPAIRPAQHAMG